MPTDGMPIPPPITETSLPPYVPVYPSMLRTVLKHLGFSRKFSAIYLARKGSPGIRTVFAMSPAFAPLWGVGVFSIINPL